MGLLGGQPGVSLAVVLSSTVQGGLRLQTKAAFCYCIEVSASR
jgi:hypothetical protein